MNLKEISFPVYRVGYIKPLQEEGVSFFLKVDNSIEVLDDRSVEAPTLAKRRLIMQSSTKLAKLTRAYFFLGDLIRDSDPKLWYIDSAGKVFQYIKSTMATLVSKKILNIIRINGGVLIEAEGTPGRFISLYPPTVEQKYISLLKLNKSHILYGFTKEYHTDTRRKI
jgi:hypothetical protein